MDAEAVIAASAACAVLLIVVALLLVTEARRDRDLAARLRSLTRTGAPPATATATGRRAALSAFSRIGEILRNRAILSERDLLDLERTVAAAGFNPRRAVSTFIGIKVTMFVLVPAAAFAIATIEGGGNELMATVIGAVVGLMGPNWALGFMRRAYMAALRRGLPDAMDMMVVCAEAGLGLDSAVARVARELAGSNRAVAAEFALLAYELKVLPDRRLALTRLAERAPIDALQRLAGTLAQTFRFGTPLAQALRVLANESRQERMLRLETKAARLPALMVLPLILFIMPCLFIVLVGPSVVTLSERLGG
jgi:tight adherence protein C